MNWFSSFVGRPFVDGGRGPDAFDCWGLVRAVYASRLGVILPDYEGIGAGEHRAVARTMQSACADEIWRLVTVLRPFDVMVARRDPHSRFPGHVGVMIDAGRVLHVWENRAVHVSRIAEPALGGLVLGFFRHRSQW